jgi:hypothetical protein
MKKVKSEKKYIRRNDIRLPQNEEEFRENLRIYFVCFDDDLFVNNLHNRDTVNINELEEISDLYSYTYRKNIIPMLTPKYEFIVGYDEQIDLIEKEFKNMSWYHINKEFMLTYFQMVLGGFGIKFLLEENWKKGISTNKLKLI